MNPIKNAMNKSGAVGIGQKLSIWKLETGRHSIVS